MQQMIKNLIQATYNGVTNLTVKGIKAIAQQKEAGIENPENVFSYVDSDNRSTGDR